jgi:hypothetical protein
MLFKPEQRTIALLICFTAYLLPASSLDAGFEKDCSDKAKKGSRDYSITGSIARGYSRSSPLGGATTHYSRKYGGTTYGGIARGYRSTRNYSAYSMEYQHCMSSFGG